jgi:small-conductance mechanosensitive channel
MRHLLALLALLFWLPLSALAQESAAAPDYTVWQSVAERVEDAVASGRASSEVFEELRAEVAGYRAAFQIAQSANAARIETVQAQLATLGPVPEAGATEPEEITTRRAELTAQLAEVRAPRLRAEEAFSRANGLIDEIDRIIRTRQTESMLSLEPSPLNPLHWGPALEALGEWTESMLLEFRQVLASPAQRDVAVQRLPAVLALLAVGLLALLRARAWSRRGATFLTRSAPLQLHWLIRTVLSGAGTVVAIAGISAIASALLAAGLVAPRMEALAATLMWMAGWIWGAAWLGHTLFPETPRGRAFLSVRQEDSRRARRALWGMGVAAALNELEKIITDGRSLIDPGAEAVLGAVPLVLGGLFAARFGQVLARVGSPAAGAEDVASGTTVYHDRVVSNAGRLLIISALVGILAELLGYSVAAAALVHPLVLTVALLGLVLVLHRALVDIYLSLSNRGSDVPAAETGDTPAEGLMPVLLGLVLVLAALPLAALAWGARWADLTEMWTAFLSGVSLGGVRISPASLVTFLIVFGLGYAATRVLQGTLRNSVLPKTRLDSGGQTAVVSGIGYVGIFLAALIAITSAGIDLSSLAIVAGALSVGIGFGLQNVVQNFISGIILLIERPVGEGDWIEVGGNMGIVKKISVRSTTIETFQRQQVIVPNGDFITGTVTNWTRGNSLGRADITVGVAYGSDTRKVHQILKEIAQGHPDVIQFPEPGVDFMGFGADSLDFRIRAMLYDVNKMVAVKTELHHRIAERFVVEGIEIPFAQRDIWIRNPEAIVPGAPATQA